MGGVDGFRLYSDNYPLGGGLPAQTVHHTYSSAVNLPAGVGDTPYGYGQDTTYSAYGQVLQEKIASGTDASYVTNTYDPHTGALTDQLLSRTAKPAALDEEAYTYDPAGNITRQTSTRLGNTTATETQCYTYDHLSERRRHLCGASERRHAERSRKCRYARGWPVSCVHQRVLTGLGSASGARPCRWLGKCQRLE